MIRARNEGGIMHADWSACARQSSPSLAGCCRLSRRQLVWQFVYANKQTSVRQAVLISNHFQQGHSIYVCSVCVRDLVSRLGFLPSSTRTSTRSRECRMSVEGAKRDLPSRGSCGLGVLLPGPGHVSRQELLLGFSLSFLFLSVYYYHFHLEC